MQIKDIERSSPMSQMMRHPIVVCPPNDANFYANGQSSSGFGALPFSYTLLQQSAGCACNVHIQVAAAGGFTAADSVTFEIVGRYNGDLRTERIVCVGDSSGTQNFPGLRLFDWIDSVTVVETTGSTGVELFSVGIGGGSGGQVIRIANPCPGTPTAAYNLQLFQIGSGTTSPANLVIGEDTNPARGDDSILTSYTAADGARICVVTFNAPLDGPAVGRL